MATGCYGLGRALSRGDAHHLRVLLRAAALPVPERAAARAGAGAPPAAGRATAPVSIFYTGSRLCVDEADHIYRETDRHECIRHGRSNAAGPPGPVIRAPTGSARRLKSSARRFRMSLSLRFPTRTPVASSTTPTALTCSDGAGAPGGKR